MLTFVDSSDSGGDDFDREIFIFNMSYSDVATSSVLNVKRFRKKRKSRTFNLSHLNHHEDSKHSESSSSASASTGSGNRRRDSDSEVTRTDSEPLRLDSSIDLGTAKSD